MEKSKLKKRISTIIKIGVSIILFYFVSTKISFKAVFTFIQESNVLWLFLSGTCLLLSQWISAIRLNYIFHNQEYYLSHKSNYQLYFIGMFYNFFIPGGIGGDAYKVYLLHKHFQWKVKKLTGAMFVDRFMGLTAIGVLLFLMTFFIHSKLTFVNNTLLMLINILLLTLTPVVSYVFVKKVFPSHIQIFNKTLFLSIIVQALQLLSIVLLVVNFDVINQGIEYCIVFLISVVLSIVSFAGIGVREYVFYQAAQWLKFNADISVAIGLLFTFLTAVISLVGIYFEIKKKKLTLLK